VEAKRVEEGMVQKSGAAVVRQIQGLIDATFEDMTDRALLDLYAQRSRQDAFAEVLRRHGRMVLGVCRRALANPADADDAFQASFLVLARRAGVPCWDESVASWLHGVARRVALKLRTTAARRRKHEMKPRVLAMPPPTPEIERAELQAVIDEEIGRLPEKHRKPLVLCCLEGQTVAQAARDLGWPIGSTSGRLARAKVILRDRLTRRGCGLAAIAAAVLDGEVEAVVVPGVVTAAVLCLAANPKVVVPGFEAIAALAAGVLREIRSVRIKAVLALALAASILAGGLFAAWDRAEPRGVATAVRPAAANAPRPVVRVWRAGPVIKWDGKRGAAWSIAFAADGKTLALGLSDGTASVRETATGKEVRVLRGHRGQVVAVMYSRSGKLLASVCDHGDLIAPDDKTLAIAACD
jgi:RNA polymerase sigma factor (sigma-70 family)